MRFDVRNAFFPTLGNEAIAAMEALLNRGAALELRSLGGAAGRVRPGS